MRVARVQEIDKAKTGRPILTDWAKSLGSISRAMAAADHHVAPDSLFTHRREVARQRLAEVEAAPAPLQVLRDKLQLAAAKTTISRRNSSHRKASGDRLAARIGRESTCSRQRQ